MVIVVRELAFHGTGNHPFSTGGVTPLPAASSTVGQTDTGTRSALLETRYR